MLCDDPEGWDGVKWEGGSSRGYIRIHIADSLYFFTAETNTTLQSYYTPIKKKFKNGKKMTILIVVTDSTYKRRECKLRVSINTVHYYK